MRRLRGLCAAIVPLLLAGCVASQKSDFSQYWQAIRTGLGGQRGKVTRAQAAAVPYASLGYRIDNGAQRLLVLATDDGQNQLWTSADHIVLLTNGGRIMRTVGLTNDLSAAGAAKGAALMPPVRAVEGPFTSLRYADFPDIGAYATAIMCRATSAGRRSVTVLGTRINTIQVNETCHSAQLRWDFTDTYWVDSSTGMVWKSLQHTHPKLGVVETTIFRPPG